MEIKNRIKFFLIFLIVVTPLLLNAQGRDESRVRFVSGASMGVLLLKISGQQDYGDGRGNVYVTSAPKYKWIDTTGVMIHLYAHAGLRIKIVNQAKWSAGLYTNAGIGFLGSIHAAEGLNRGLTLVFPEYAFFEWTFKDYSAIQATAGYRFTMAPLNFHSFTTSIGYSRQDFGSISLYVNPVNTRYYTYFSNGTIKPLLRFTEFGLLMSFYFEKP